MISKNVMKCQEFDNAVFYKIGCDCMYKECDITLEIESRDKDIILSLCQTLFFQTEGDSKIKTIWNRLKGAFKVLIKGELETEGALYMHDRDHIESFTEALDEGIKKLEKGRDK